MIAPGEGSFLKGVGLKMRLMYVCVCVCVCVCVELLLCDGCMKDAEMKEREREQVREHGNR